MNNVCLGAIEEGKGVRKMGIYCLLTVDLPCC
jgi:hypothetical protein